MTFICPQCGRRLAIHRNDLDVEVFPLHMLATFEDDPRRTLQDDYRYGYNRYAAPANQITCPGYWQAVERG